MASPRSGTSVTLLNRLRDPADAEAWKRLDRIYTGLLRAWFARAGLQPADRDDLTQSALEIVLRRIPEFQHNGRPGAFRAWLRLIATNLLHEYWRVRPAAGADSILAELADPASPLSIAWNEEHEKRLLHGLLELARPEFTESTWQAFSRVVLEGAPAKQAAKELQITSNAVLIAKSRVLARLRELSAGLE